MSQPSSPKERRKFDRIPKEVSVKANMVTYPVNETDALNEYDSCLTSPGIDSSQCEKVRLLHDPFADDEADYGS